MRTTAIEATGRLLGTKVIALYAAAACLLLGSALTLKVVRTGGWEERVFAVLPMYSTSKAAEVNKAKIREALDTLPGTIAKIGFALLGVAAIGRGTRSLERSTTASEPISGEEVRPFQARAIDRILPVALAALVFVQVAPSLNRPLIGDELENYEKHLTLPLKGMLTTMEGANNQLGFTILSWSSMRAFGDTPFSVRLPALLGGMLLPVVAYRLGSREFGRAAAAILGLALALWPDCTMAAMQGRSYSLLMVAALAHIYYFRRFVLTGDRGAGLGFAATLAAACTLHLWFVIVVGAELVILSLLKLDERLRAGVVGGRTGLGVETFLVFMTLGGLGAAVIQAGILPKFVYVLTQKNPTPVDAGRVLASMAESQVGIAFDNGQIAPEFRDWTGFRVLRPAIGLLTLAGLLACVRSSQRSPAARFQIGSYLVIAATLFAIVYIQKPVYIYARFYLVLPLCLFWAAARGWGALIARAVPSESRLAKASERAVPA
jgi:hypothetical protein